MNEKPCKLYTVRISEADKPDPAQRRKMAEGNGYHEYQEADAKRYARTFCGSVSG